MASPRSSLESRAHEFRRFLGNLMQGEPARLDDTSRPPWFEVGLVCEVSGEIYSRFLAMRCWTNGSTFASGDSSGPIRLFWQSHGKCFGRELTPAEARRFAELGQVGKCCLPHSEGIRFDAGPIRLACMHCDTEACDGIDRIPANWVDVDEFQSCEQSLQQVTPADTTRSPTEWYTHLGVCPECQITHGR